ncbi:transposase-like protein [Streptococcus rupicaprae]|uniref:Transposase-like protein n=1 Tax=Streptococcus rupicaprae TaxID=759619 RepID=A0ABV2FII7_9STRE
MSKRSPKPVEEKLNSVLQYLEQGVAIFSLVNSYAVSQTTLKSWISRYQRLGIEGLTESRTWKHYGKALKEQAVQDELAGLGGLETIVERYNSSQRSVLKRWINQYTSGKA